MRAFALGLLGVAVFSCSTHRDGGGAIADIAGTRAFGAELARATLLTKTGSSFHGALGELEIDAPLRADGVATLARSGVAGAWLELQPQGVRDAAAVVDRGALVFPRATEQGDIVFVASPGALEELRVVRSGSTYAARYSMKTGPAIADVRVRDGRVEAIDRGAAVLLGSAPAFMVDSSGARRDLVARVERSGEHAFEVSFSASLEGLSFPVVADPVWSAVGSMKTPRLYHTAITLADGKVLVFGGRTTGYVTTSTSERYDPATNTWTDVGNMPAPLMQARAVLLKSGKVFAIYESTAALYDPISATWTTANAPMYGYAAGIVVLDDGRVLGFQSGGPNAPLSWSESTGTWTTHAAPPTGGVVSFSTAKLADGRVLLAGGVDAYGKRQTTSQVYDPTTDSWTVTTPLAARRELGSMLRLASGKVLLAGGNGVSGPISTTEIFDPSTSTWAAGPLVPGAYGFTTLAPLPGATILLHNDNTARTWVEGLPALETMGSQPASAPYQVAIAPLANGALVIGGTIGSDPIATTSRLVPLALGAACSASTPGDCLSGLCVDGVCCASACDGACQRCNASGACENLTGAPHSGRSCAPYGACAAGACVSSCTADGDCDSASYCVGSSCVAKKVNGASCTLARECTSGTCVDGVCCNSACTGQCEACDLPTSLGTCAAVTGLPRGSRTACASTGECAPVCDGVTRSTCVFLPAGSTPCGKNGCSGGTETHASTCNGAGACSDVPKSCGSYVCGAVTCKTACGGKADCAPGFLCALGACVPAPGLGEACKTGAECSTGFCVDGVCCGVPSCGAGSTCAAKGAAGQCRKTLGIACAANAECESALCVDGVCCDSACTGQCEACSVPGSVGKCVAAKGAPRGTRPACPTDAAAPCASRTCDGVEPASCVGYAPKDTSCRVAGCKDAVATASATCDGAGACPAATTVACGAYACDEAGSSCRTRCEDASHCVAGNLCVDGACVPSTTTCSGDGLARFGADGTVKSCAPFRCKGGECATSCGTTTDCAPGLVCADSQCIAPTPSDDSGGCSVTRSTSPRGAWLVLGAAILALARRRRGLLSLALGLLGCSPSRVDPAPKKIEQPIAISTTTETVYAHARGWALTLTGGDVLIGGGELNGRPERRSASTGAWKQAASSFSTTDSVGIPIPGGKVLVAGGQQYAASPVPTEVYDPATDTSAVSGTMLDDHRYPIGAWLPSVGKALVAGGASASTTTSTAELWTPSTGAWTPTGSLNVARVLAASVTLASGKVLVIGGSSSLGSTTALSTVETFDPATGTFTYVASMAKRRGQPNAVLLADGRVLVTGGVDETSTRLSSAEIYSPSSNTWTTVPSMSRARSSAMLARLPSGRVLVAGGYSVDATLEVYDPTRNAWLAAGAMSAPRWGGTTATLGDGRLLLIGGYDSSSLATWTVEVFTEQPNGATCTAAGECTSGFCVDGLCCDVACGGACQACDVSGNLGKCTAISGAPRSSHPSCAPYVSCNAGACATSCTSDPDCAPTAYCSSNACVAKKANGAACTLGSQCSSGACADGVCCDKACSGQCEACAEPGKIGTCTTIAGSPRGARPACTGIAVGGQCGIQCNGVEPKGCVYPPATRSCSASACAAGVETHVSTCNGVGLCNDVPKTCGAFACGTVACKTTCAATADCAAGFVCKTGACVPAPGLGMACSSSAPCEGGLSCTDGVCCGESTCGAGNSCGLPATAGRCAKIDGQACASDGECGSGVCVDGVCCESRCAGQCQACDVAGSVGKCVAVTGAPHGARPECAKGANVCEASRCDGSDGSRCAALADTSVTCREASCSDGVATQVATCDGKGACGSAITAACAPYGCDGATCATSCATSNDCAKGYDCTAGACTKASAHCSTDGVAVVDPDGLRASCLPYKCRDAACITRCVTSDDCAPGTVCDGAGTCTTASTVAPEVDDGGGCTASPRPARGGALVLVSFVAMALRRRRHRPSR